MLCSSGRIFHSTGAGVHHSAAHAARTSYEFIWRNTEMLEFGLIGVAQHRADSRFVALASRRQRIPSRFEAFPRIAYSTCIFPIARPIHRKIFAIRAPAAGRRSHRSSDCSFICSAKKEYGGAVAVEVFGGPCGKNARRSRTVWHSRRPKPCSPGAKSLRLPALPPPRWRHNNASRWAASAPLPLAGDAASWRRRSMQVLHPVLHGGGERAQHDGAGLVPRSRKKFTFCAHR